MPRLNNRNTRKSEIKRWKTYNEKEILESFFALDPTWSRKTISYVSKLVKLSEEQIYKWGYEQKRKTYDEKQSSSDCAASRIDNFNPNASLDYNIIVDELFPSGLLMDDQLSKQEKQTYDALKSKLMMKDK